MHVYTIVQNNAVSRKLSAISTILPFLLLLVHQPENMFHSMYFSIWRAGRSHTVRNLANKKDDQAQDCTCQLKTASQMRHCERVHFLCEGSTSRSFTNQVFYFYSFFELKQRSAV